LRFSEPSEPTFLGDLTLVTIRELLSGLLVFLSMILLLVETTGSDFLVVRDFFPISEVICLVAVTVGL
jgi:hypothetical protein